MRSRRFVALFGGRTADGPGELRSEENGNEEAGEYGSSDRGSAADVGRRDAGGTARHASARATWRETIRANNRQEAPPSWRERGTTVVLNLAPLAGTTKQKAAKWSSPMAPRRFPTVRLHDTNWRAKLLLAIISIKINHNVKEHYFPFNFSLLCTFLFVYFLSKYFID